MNQQQGRGRPKVKTDADITARKQNYHKKYYLEHADKYLARSRNQYETVKKCKDTNQESMVNFELPAEASLPLQTSH